MKTLQTNDAFIKKFTDDLNQKKQRRQVLAKKEGGNLLTRDYIDDIYNSASLTKGDFIEGKGAQMSESFINMLLVVPKAKLPGLLTDLKTIMKEYYDNMDKNVEKRYSDDAKIRLGEMKDQQPLMAKFCSADSQVEMPPNAPESIDKEASPEQKAIHEKKK